MFTCMLGRCVASTVLLVPKLSEGADSIGGQLRGDNEWRNQSWQSLEEGAGKRCSECGT